MSHPGAAYPDTFRMVFFTAAFVALGLVAVALEVASRRGVGGGGTPTTPDFKRLQRLYLAVYFMSVMGDWLQGPYVYALYEHYQFSKQQIAWLFIVGFGSSMIFGPFAGTAADKYGRKVIGLTHPCSVATGFGSSPAEPLAQRLGE